MSNWNRVAFYGVDADRPSVPDPANGTSQAWISTDTQEIRQSVISGGVLAWQIVANNGGGGGGGDYILIQDQQSSGTQGGTFTSGAWRTRVLNTEVVDTGGHASLASNQITLAAGTYRLRASAPAHYCGLHQCRFQNVTDATTVATGTSEYLQSSAGTSQTNRTFVEARFTIAGSKAFELQHQCSVTRATDGLGVGTNFGTEVFASVELIKE